jgi:transcriptional regulator with XRE-family HTH domain
MCLVAHGAKNSQADLERRCGLARCRISWLEHGRAVPTLETLQRIVDALEIFVHRLLLEDQQHTQERRLPALVMRNSLPYLANSALEIFAAAREGRLFSSVVARGGLPSHRPDHGRLAVDPLSRAAAAGWASLAEHGHRGGRSGSRTPVIGKSKCRWHSTFPSGA